MRERGRGAGRRGASRPASLAGQLARRVRGAHMFAMSRASWRVGPSGRTPRRKRPPHARAIRSPRPRFHHVRLRGPEITPVARALQLPAMTARATASTTTRAVTRLRQTPRRANAPRPKIEQGVAIDKLGFLVRFWQLKGRHATLSAPLSSSEQVELLSLMQLVTSDFRMPPPGSCARPSNALPAQLIGEGTILAVEVRHVCAAALLVAGVKAMSIGERVVIRTADAVSGVEF